MRRRLRPGPVEPPTARGLVAATSRRFRSLLALTVWALIGALPTLVSGQAVARAVDDGFLAGRTPTGLTWLGVLAATVPVGAFGARRTYLGVARLVEPLRDALVTRVVEGALRSSTGAAASGHAGAVARLTQHVEVVRDTVAGLLLLLLSFVATVLAAMIGLVTLAPIVLPLVAVPLAVSFVTFALSLPEVARRQRRVLLAEEKVADLAGETATGLRDIVACGGEDLMRSVLGGAVDEQVAAGRALARVAALRTVIVALGGRVPLLLVLVLSGWLLDRGLSAGALLGTLTYLLQGLGPAVSSVVGGLGIPLAQLTVTVDRIDTTVPAEAGAGGDAVPAGDALAPGGRAGDRGSRPRRGPGRAPGGGRPERGRQVDAGGAARGPARTAGGHDPPRRPAGARGGGRAPGADPAAGLRLPGHGRREHPLPPPRGHDRGP
jgi:ATP-binding cassette subfamily C protein